MTSANLPPAILVTRPAQLEEAVDLICQAPLVAVDTESNSLYAYREQVCLIQFSIPQVDYLVDPLALADLSLLERIFCDPAIEKVFHAAEYDVLCLKRDYGFEFSNLFDTMVAARILGREQVGLGALLEAEYGVQLDKRYQRANWGQRPLPPDLLSYARLDTHYLIPLSQRLRQELDKRNLASLAHEDFERLRQINGHNGGGNNDDPMAACWRVHGANDLSPQQAAVLAQLCQYREQMARTMDRPVFKVINDNTLLEIAQYTPHSREQLARIQGMNEGQVRRHGARLLEAVGRGLNNPPLYPPRQERPSEAFMKRLEILRHWRKTAGEQMGVGSDVILPRDLMHALAEKDPQTAEELAQILCDVPWRREHFGEEILRVLSKRKK